MMKNTKNKTYKKKKYDIYFFFQKYWCTLLDVCPPANKNSICNTERSTSSACTFPSTWLASHLIKQSGNECSGLMTTEKGGSRALNEMQPLTCAHVGWPVASFPGWCEETTNGFLHTIRATWRQIKIYIVWCTDILLTLHHFFSPICYLCWNM